MNKQQIKIKKITLPDAWSARKTLSTVLVVEQKTIPGPVFSSRWAMRCSTCTLNAAPLRRSAASEISGREVPKISILASDLS